MTSDTYVSAGSTYKITVNPGPPDGKKYPVIRGVTATSRVRPAGSRSVIGANVVVIHCVSSLLDSGWFEHSATWVTNRGEPMSVTVGSRAPSVQLMILIVD